MTRTLVRIAAGMLLALASAPATSEPGAPRAVETSGDASPGRFHQGGKSATLVAGYGVGFRVGSDEDRKKSAELEDVRIVNVLPRFGIGLTDPVGGDSWYRGNLETTFEGALLVNTEPHSGVGGGVGTALRWNFLFAEEVVVPYVDIYVGIVGIDFDLERQSDGFNLNVGAGAGAHWFVRPRIAIDTEVRWQHISNAGTSKPNDGINDVLFLLGASYYFD